MEKSDIDGSEKKGYISYGSIDKLLILLVGLIFDVVVNIVKSSFLVLGI